MSHQTIISFGEFLDRFYYYGLLSVYVLLAIFFTGSSPNAIRAYGLYTMFGFSLPIILGYFADKWSQHYLVTVSGLLFLILSFCVLMIDYNHAGFVISSALLLLGVGCFKSNNLKLFVDYNNHKGEFNRYYAFMTAGSIIGPLIFGYYYEREMRNLIIPMLITTLIAIITLGIYAYFFSGSLRAEFKNKATAFTLAMIMAASLLLILGSYYSDIAYDAYLILITGIVFVIFTKINNGKLIQKLLVLFLYSSLFFVTEMIASGILLLYVKNNLGTVFYSIHIPLPYFIMFFSLAAVLFALTLPRYLVVLEKKITHFHYYKLLIGGCSGAASMFLLVISKQINTNVGILIVLFSMLLMGFSDFIIVPSILTYLDEFAMGKIKSSLYSLWLISIGFSGYLSVKLFNWVTLIPTQNSLSTPYLTTFFLSGTLLLLTLPLMKILKK